MLCKIVNYGLQYTETVVMIPKPNLTSEFVMITSQIKEKTKRKKNKLRFHLNWPATAISIIFCLSKNEDRKVACLAVTLCVKETTSVPWSLSMMTLNLSVHYQLIEISSDSSVLILRGTLFLWFCFPFILSFQKITHYKG